MSEACAGGSVPRAQFNENAADVVIDKFGGAECFEVLQLSRRGCRYASSGTISVPPVTLDLRDMYSNDITMFRSTGSGLALVFDLVGYIERGKNLLIAKLLQLRKSQRRNCNTHRRLILEVSS